MTRTTTPGSPDDTGSPGAAAGPGTRPALRPGDHVLRRSRDLVQVGLDPEHRVVVQDGTLPRATERQPADAALLRALPPHGSGAVWQRHTLAALARTSADRFAAALARRRAVTVAVTTFGHPLADDLRDQLVSLCARSGLSTSRRRHGPPPRGAAEGLPVKVLIGVGEPPRDLADAWTREGVTHLVVRLSEGRLVLGPFVVPGRTACLRCTDAHHADDDPVWPLLLEQYAAAASRDRADGVPEPVDAALAALGVAWAARELASYAEGAAPGTLSSTITVGPRLETLESRSWPRHRRCGCGWA